MVEENVKMPLLGEIFPQLGTVNTTHGAMDLPGDMKGSWFVLFSHPADFTPVCTTEFVSFQKHKADFDALKCKLIGLSVDQVFSHIKWVEWINENLNVEISFPIIAANDTIAMKMGMLHPGKGSNTVRAVFVVDPDSKIRLILYYPQEIGRNISEVVRAAKAMQISDKQGAMPANWPENELIQDRVILPPAMDVKTAQKRPSENECFDWWFCHKPLKK